MSVLLSGDMFFQKIDNQETWQKKEKQKRQERTEAKNMNTEALVKWKKNNKK